MLRTIEQCREAGNSSGEWAADDFTKECVGKGPEQWARWVNAAVVALEEVIANMRKDGTSEEAIATYRVAWFAKTRPVVDSEFGRHHANELLRRAGIPIE